MTNIEKMILRALKIGQEMIDAGNPGYMFTVALKGGESLEAAFEHYYVDQGYLESMHPDAPTLVPIDQIVHITVQAV